MNIIYGISYVGITSRFVYIYIYKWGDFFQAWAWAGVEPLTFIYEKKKQQTFQNL